MCYVCISLASQILTEERGSGLQDYVRIDGLTFHVFSTPKIYSTKQCLMQDYHTHKIYHQIQWYVLL